MCPSGWFHAAAATYRADSDIKIPDCFQQFCNRHTCISPPELLVPLQFKNELQVLCFCTVVQKTIITDLLETMWKYMHQVPSDEFLVIKSDLTPGVTGFPATCRKSHFFFGDGKDPAV